ncbi:hypothetical protein MASR2M48_07300 [Spirochaetota bacterium]
MQSAEFLRCPGCGLWRQEPQPAPEAIQGRYGDDYLQYETSKHLEYRAISLKSLKEAGLVPQDSTDQLGKQRSILEIGCATGALLSTFKEAGWNATGIELGPSMAAYARSVFGLNIIEGTIESAQLPDESYDVVMATHLIEHLNDPRSFLKEARRLMRPGARLYLITPNASGFQARIMGSRWRSVIRDHLYLFSKLNLSALLRAEAYTVDYLGTWGAWPAGMKPGCIKKPVDTIAKHLGWGDVMILSAHAGGL